MTGPGLRDRACPLCGAQDAAGAVTSPVRADRQSLGELRPFWFGIEKERRFFTYHRCRACNMLFNRNFFDEGQLAELYSSMPPNMDLVAEDAVEATQHGYFEDALQSGLLPPGGDYLEIGPDVGYIVREAAERGNFDHFWLFEPNRAVHDVLRAATNGKPATILSEMTDLSAVPDGSVGLAVIVHVLDHLLDPLAMLTAVRAKLRPDGALMMVTHDERSLLARVLGPRWPAYCLQHPQLYNPDTIVRLCERAGFVGVQVGRSANHFPLDFLGRQAMGALGLRNAPVPLPKRAVKVRLGNIITLAAAGATGRGATRTQAAIPEAEATPQRSAL